MEMIEHLRRQWAYNAWANRAVLAGFRASGAPTKRALQLVAHIVAAESLWLERIQRQQQSFPVWPEFDLDRCEKESASVSGKWREYLDGLSVDGLSTKVSYKNTQGQLWTSAIGDINTHVLMHSAYHRGQIASHLRENGQTPVLTDFIHAVRQGFVE